MNLLTIKKGNKRYDLQIDNIKYCIGNNFEEKYNFVKYFKRSIFIYQKKVNILLIIQDKHKC